MSERGERWGVLPSYWSWQGQLNQTTAETEDAILGAMYPADDLAGAEQRLRDFLVGRFGGPQRYVEQRGHLVTRA